jgi:signal transduction histidine kinase
MATGERDLQQIVLDLHDGPVQYLFAAISQLQLATTALDSRSDAGLRVRQGLSLLERALGEIRDLIGTFRPPGFERRELADLIEGLVVQHETLTDQPIDLTVDPRLGECSLPTKIALYRIVQEALANGYRHAGAARQRVQLRRRGSLLRLTVADDGRGFDVERVLRLERNVAVEGGHYGLRGIQDRVALLGGSFSVWSRPGEGTELTVTLPCE